MGEIGIMERIDTDMYDNYNDDNNNHNNNNSNTIATQYYTV